MAEKPPEEGYISVVDEEPEIFELLKWDSSQSQRQQTQQQQQPPQTSSTSAQNVDSDDEKLSAKIEKKGAKIKQEDCDPFELPDPVFMETYRLTKELAKALCEELKPVMPEPTKPLEFSHESKVLSALLFYATGKYQKTIVGKTDPNITQYFVSTAVVQVTEALNNAAILKKYIHFPHLREERDLIKARFYMKYGIPNVVGAVDCTHIPMYKPDDDRSHFNKSYHSKKVQIISDSDLNILSVEAKSGGSHSHDHILNKHAVKNDLESMNKNGEECWLVGGPYYTQKPHVMTPVHTIKKKSPEGPEKYYNNVHASAHNAVMQTIKQIKSRWKCLQATCSNRQFDPKTVSMIVTACCVLHNICNSRGLPILQMAPGEERLEIMKQKVANGAVPKKPKEHKEGMEARKRLIERLWNERQVPETPKKRFSKKSRLLESQEAMNNIHVNPNEPHVHTCCGTMHNPGAHNTQIQNNQPMNTQPMNNQPIQNQANQNNQMQNNQHQNNQGMQAAQGHPGQQACPTTQGHQMSPHQMQQNHHMSHAEHDDPAKRPRIVMNNPHYNIGVGVPPSWGHFQQH